MSKLPEVVEIAYFDQAESLSQHLPRRGRVLADCVDRSGRPWWLVSLDAAFEYATGTTSVLTQQVRSVDAFLISPRHVGDELGAPGDLHVHILVVPAGAQPSEHEINRDDYDHVAWGTCKVLA